VSDMTAMSEFQALVTAIGEYTVDALGRENLTGMQVTLNPREMAAFMSIALEDRSDAAQKAAISELFEIERVYSDEVVLTYVFVDEVSEPADSALESVPQFSLV